MNVKEIAESISAEDRELILNNTRSIRRSKIEVIQDEHNTIDTEIDEQVAEDQLTSSNAKRKSVDRVWPKAGEVCIAKNPWTGEEHQVLVVENSKRKHGVEFETEDGKRFHSPSPLCQYLFKKRVSNGWKCITWF